MQEWYYSKAGSQFGPVTSNEIRALLADGSLDAAATLVWKAGMADWTAAANLSELMPGEAASMAVLGDGSPAAPEPATIASGSERIDAVACLKRGFDLTVRNFGNALLAMLAMILIPFGVMLMLSIATGILAAVAGDNQAVMIGTSILMFAALQLCVTWLMLGFHRFALKAVSSRDANLTDLFGEAKQLIPAVIAGLLFGIVVGVGFLLLLVPGVYLVTRYGFFLTAMVDRKCGVAEAFSYSSQLTRNNRLNLFVLLLLSMVVSWLGVLALGIGLLFAYPMVWIAWTVAYRWLQFGNQAAMDHPGTKVPMLSPRP